jgi:hypothetical protein
VTRFYSPGSDSVDRTLGTSERHEEGLNGHRHNGAKRLSDRFQLKKATSIFYVDHAHGVVDFLGFGGLHKRAVLRGGCLVYLPSTLC